MTFRASASPNGPARIDRCAGSRPGVPSPSAVGRRRPADSGEAVRPTVGDPGMLPSQSMVLEPIGLEPEHAEWARLAEASTNVFLIPTWLSTWWRHFGTTASRLCSPPAATGTDACEACSPSTSGAPRPDSRPRLIGHGQADVNGFLCCDADAPRWRRPLDG